MDNIFSIGEVAKLLGIQQYRISYAIVSGQIPEASFRFLGKRCFNEEDINRIAEHFGVQDLRTQTSDMNRLDRTADESGTESFRKTDGDDF